jgi:prepilin-type N-terminal cleavage/methylation domain-containing protein
MIQRSIRRAYTLTELLVVITIVTILLAATLPIAKRVMDDSRTRDSARLLAGNFAMARTHAARNNRPYGLWFELTRPLGLPATVQQCTQVYLAEVPPPYAGSTTNSRGIIRVEPGQTSPEFVPLYPAFQDTTPADGYNDQDTLGEKQFLVSLIDEGDTCLVKFEYKGDWFRLIRGKATNALYPDPNRLYYLMTVPGTFPANWVTGSVSGSAIPPAYNNQTSPGFRFQILRTPRRVGNPIELIAGTCIDLEYSGMGPQGGEFAVPLNYLVVMFSAKGDIDGLIADGVLSGPTGTLHFLIGQVGKMNDPGGPSANHPTGLNMFDPAASNLSDVNSVWVSVGRLNGQITTTENLIPTVQTTPPPTPTSLVIFPGDPRQQTLNPSLPADRGVYLQYCREVATNREQMGGK